MCVPGRRKARPAPAVTERAWARRRGAQAVGDRAPDRHLQRPDRTPRFPATPPEVSGPPNPDPSAVSPSPAGAGGSLLCLRRNLPGGLR